MEDPANDPMSLIMTGTAPLVLYQIYNGDKTAIKSIMDLPLELLAMIFWFCTMDQRGSMFLRTLQLVCRSWKMVIDGTTTLWRTVQIELVDNQQVDDIRASLQRRLRVKYPKKPLRIEVYLGGQHKHPEDCDCEETGECKFQDELCESLRKLLRILIGRSGRHFSRWEYFVLDLMEWAYPGSVISGTFLDFRNIFSYPAPLLHSVELWAVNSVDHLFGNATNLRSIRLMDCMLPSGISLAHIRELWVDHMAIDVSWVVCTMVEELTLRIPREVTLGQIPDGFVFPNIRILRLLGHVSPKVLDAVGNRHLEQLVLLLNSPVDLQRVVNSSLQIKEIDEIVLGGFFQGSYSADLNPKLFGPEARKAALVSFVQRNGNCLENVTLFGDRIEEELQLAGFDVEELEYWDEEMDFEMIGEIEDWSEEGNDWNVPTGIIDEVNYAADNEDEEMGEAEAN